MKKTLKQRVAELTTAQIVELLRTTWDDPTGPMFREIGFDIIEDRHGEAEADRIYSDLWHACKKPFARAVIQYRPANPAGYRYDVSLFTRCGDGFAYAGNGKAFPDNIAAEAFARSNASLVEFAPPAI